MEVHIVLNLMITGSTKIAKNYHFSILLQLNTFQSIFIFHRMTIFIKLILILI